MPANSNTPANAALQPHGAPMMAEPISFSELFDYGNTPSGLDLSEFMVPGDLDFLNAFDMARVAL